MRVLIFVETFMYPTLTFVYNEINKISEHHEVKVVTTKRLFSESYPFSDVEVLPITESRITKRIFWELEKRDFRINRKNRKFAASLRTIIEEFKPDIIHGHFGYESITLLDNLVPDQTPVFVTFHGYDASQMLSRQSYVTKMNQLIRKFDLNIICASNYMKKELLGSGMHVCKANINYYGIDCDRFRSSVKEQKGDCFRFLQISSFIEKKGHRYTLEAFRKFLDGRHDKEKFKLILVGDLDEFEVIKELCDKMGLSDFVEFPGRVNAEGASEYLALADAFVHHSIVGSRGDKEGIPNSIIEAMATELPIISTWHSGIPELVEDGVNGYLVKEKDVDDYARRMQDILSWRKVKENRQKVLQQFSLDLHMKKLMGYYEEALVEKKIK
jgi:colanic acid/amylovoran biosynthesis glycosyltransferase